MASGTGQMPWRWRDRCPAPQPRSLGPGHRLCPAPELFWAWREGTPINEQGKSVHSEATEGDRAGQGQGERSQQGPQAARSGGQAWGQVPPLGPQWRGPQITRLTRPVVSATLPNDSRILSSSRAGAGLRTPGRPLKGTRARQRWPSPGEGAAALGTGPSPPPACVHSPFLSPTSDPKQFRGGRRPGPVVGVPNSSGPRLPARIGGAPRSGLGAG